MNKVAKLPRDEDDTKAAHAQRTAARDKIRPVAEDYLGRGWKPIPIHPECKKPEGIEAVDWPTKTYTTADFRPWHHNIGVQFSVVSNGLNDVDLDCDAARKLAQYFLPETSAVFGRKSAPKSHWLYYSDLDQNAEMATTKCEDPTDSAAGGEHGVCLVELRTGRIERKGDKETVIGAQTMFPPSTHPSGE